MRVYPYKNANATRTNRKTTSKSIITKHLGQRVWVLPMVRLPPVLQPPGEALRLPSLRETMRQPRSGGGIRIGIGPPWTSPTGAHWQFQCPSVVFWSPDVSNIIQQWEECAGLVVQAWSLDLSTEVTSLPKVSDGIPKSPNKVAKS